MRCYIQKNKLINIFDDNNITIIKLKGIVNYNDKYILDTMKLYKECLVVWYNVVNINSDSDYWSYNNISYHNINEKVYIELSKVDEEQCNINIHIIDE